MTGTDQFGRGSMIGWVKVDEIPRGEMIEDWQRVHFDWR